MGNIYEVGLSDGMRMADSAGGQSAKRVPRRLLGKAFKNYGERDIIFLYVMDDGSHLALRDPVVMLRAVLAGETDEEAEYVLAEMMLEEKGTRLVLVKKDG